LFQSEQDNFVPVMLHTAYLLDMAALRAPCARRSLLAAYDWPVDLSDDEILTRLLALNLARAGKQGAEAGD